MCDREERKSGRKRSPDKVPRTGGIRRAVGVQSTAGQSGPLCRATRGD